MLKRADSLYAVALLLLSGAARAAEPQCDRGADDVHNADIMKNAPGAFSRCAKPKCQKWNTMRKKTRRKAKGKK